MYSNGYGNSMTTVQVNDLNSCNAAAQQAKQIEGFASNVKTICIEGVAK